MHKDPILKEIEDHSEKLLKKCKYDHELFCAEVREKAKEFMKKREKLLAKKNKKTAHKRTRKAA